MTAPYSMTQFTDITPTHIYVAILTIYNHSCLLGAA
jgi:hypothetical protein